MKGQRGNSHKDSTQPEKHQRREWSTNSRSVGTHLDTHDQETQQQHRTPRKTTRPNNEDRNVPIIAVENQLIKAEHCAYKVT